MEPKQQGQEALWQHIRAGFIEAHRICDEAKVKEELAQAQQESSDPLTGKSGAAQSLDGEPAPAHADMVAVRAAIRKLLDGLRKRLAEQLSEREVYYCLFPMVIYIDEMVQFRLSSAASGWQPLQRELYKIDNGGELFYEGIDNLMSKPETLPIIFEVFYFCISSGFRGRYLSDPDKLKYYRSMLSQRIPTRHLVGGDPEKQLPPARIDLVAFPKWYYAAAVGTGALALVLAFVASYLELHL